MPRREQCTSACVMMFLGGVSRDGEGLIGLHRPFSSAIPGSTAESQLSFDRINQRVRQYLKEMNVPGQVLDLMNSVPPGEVKWLSMESDRDKLKELLVIGVDPVVQDEGDSIEAKFIGISKKELYQRKMKADTICGKKGNFSTLEEYHEYNDCKLRIIDPNFRSRFLPDRDKSGSR